MRKGQISKNDGDEFAAKIIMILALMATHKRFEDERTRKVLFKVRDILETLLGKDLRDQRFNFGDIKEDE